MPPKKLRIPIDPRPWRRVLHTGTGRHDAPTDLIRGYYAYPVDAPLNPPPSGDYGAFWNFTTVVSSVNLPSLSVTRTLTVACFA